MGADRIETNRDGNKAEQPNALCEFGRAMFYSAIQAPVNSVSQLANELCGDNTFGKMGLISDPAKLSMSQSSWYAQQLGNAAGMILPFSISQKFVKAGSATAASRLGLAESTTLSSFAKSTRGMNSMNIGQATATGFTCDFLFSPTVEGKDVLTGHFKNGVTGAATFGSLSAFNVGLTSTSKRSLSTTAPWEIHSTKRDIGRHMLSGAGAGVVSANTHALMEGKLASMDDVAESALTMAAFGGLMRGKQELSSKRLGATSISDVISKNPELQKAVQADPVAQKIVADYGMIKVDAKAGTGDFYKLMETSEPTGTARDGSKFTGDSRVTVLKEGEHKVSSGIYVVETGASVKAYGDAILLCKGGSIETYEHSRARISDGTARAYEQSFVDARGSSSVVALEQSRIVAHDQVKVEARNVADVTTKGRSFATLCEYANGTALDQSSMVVTGKARAIAHGDAKLTAKDLSTVIATETAKVTAHDKALVMATDNSQVHAFGDARVVASGHADIVAANRVHVDSSEHTTVKLSDTSTGDIRGRATVLLTGESYAKVREQSHVTAVDNTAASLFDTASGVFRGTSRADAVNKASVRASENSHVNASGKVWVELSGNAEGNLFQHARGLASGKAKVTLNNETQIVARDKADVLANDSSKCEAHNSVRLRALDHSKVTAHDTVNLSLSDNAVGTGSGATKAEATGKSTLTAKDRTTVKATDESTIFASGGTRVIASGSSNVAASENAKVLAMENANVQCTDNVKVRASGNCQVVVDGTGPTPLEPGQGQLWRGSILEKNQGTRVGETYSAYGLTVIGNDSATIVGKRAEIVAKGNCRVGAEDSLIHASGNADVTGYRNSYVVASGNAKVRLQEGASATASGNVKVEAMGVDNFVQARDKVSVVAPGSTRVDAGGDSRVKATGTSMVRAKDFAVVDVSQGASVSAIDNARVNASGRSNVRVQGKATAEASDRAFVEAWGEAKVVTSGEGHVVLNDRAAAIATDHSVVEARGRSEVTLATDNVQVRRFDISKVHASGGATVITPFDSPAIKLKDGATIVISPLEKPLILEEGKRILLDQFHYRAGTGTGGTGKSATK